MKKGRIANGIQRVFIFGCVASLMTGLFFTGGKASVAEEISGKTEICTLKSVTLTVPTDDNAESVTITGGLQPIVVDKTVKWSDYFGIRSIESISFMEDTACTAKGQENHSYVAAYLFTLKDSETTGYGRGWVVNRQETETGYWYEWMCTTPYAENGLNYVSSGELSLDESVGYYDVKFEPRFGMIDGTSPTGIYVRFAKEYNITYNLDGGRFTEAAPTTYMAGTEVTLPTPTKDGYTFAGWTGTDVDTATKTVTIPTEAVGDYSYVATWEKIVTEPTQPTPTPDPQPTITVGDKMADKDNKATYQVTKSAEGNVEVAYVAPTSKTKTVSIPATVTLADGTTAKVTAIAAKAFKGNTKLQTVTIGKNVKTIGKEAFSGCKNLKKVKSAKNVTTIGEKAFYKCTKLAKITIPKNVNSIGKSAFQGCSKLKTITIKTTKLTKKNVKKNAFKGIHSKAKIDVPNSKVKAYKSILKARGVGKKVTIK